MVGTAIAALTLIPTIALALRRHDRASAPGTVVRHAAPARADQA
ncbi:hypothetical protein [Streptomyces bicolor]|nr:hypothetical protein [Streptomyces bicolor]